MSGITNLDVGHPRRPFSEDSAKRLYRALKNVEEALNDQDLSTTRVFQQIPVRAMEARQRASEVKDLMVWTEVDLRTAKRWLFARNKMITVDDPEGVDMHDQDLAVEMIVESTRVFDQVTELAEKWQELALKPVEVDERIRQWFVQVTKIKTEVRMLLSLLRSATAIRRVEIDPLQWIVDHVPTTRQPDEWKELMTAKTLGLGLEDKTSTKLTPAQQACRAYREVRK